MLAATSVIVGLGVCLSGSWELTFILFLAIPLIIIAHQIEFSLYSEGRSKDDDSLTRAANIVVETKDNMKTVLSLGAEEYLVNTVKGGLNLHLK